MSHMVVIHMALVEVGGGRVDGLDCNQGCLLWDCVEMVVARDHGLADGGRAGHFWWQEERYDSCHCCFCVNDCSHCALRSCIVVHGDLSSCMQKNMNAITYDANAIIHGAKVVSQNNVADGEFSLIDTEFRRGLRWFAVKVLDLVCKLQMRISFWFSVIIQIAS